MHFKHSKQLVRWVALGVFSLLFGGQLSAQNIKGDKKPASSNTQQYTVSLKGVVVDKKGEPLIGVTVRIKGTKLGFRTNINGEFLFKGDLPTPTPTLILSYMGYQTKEVQVSYNTSNKIVLEENTQLLNEVVITGIFQRKKEGFTGSANTMTGKEITQMTSGNVLKAIELLDPGFRLGSNLTVGSNPSGLPDFNLRGKSSMGDYSTDEKVILRGDVDTRPNQPLFVLDGIIGVSVTKIIDLDPTLIESVTILKDAAAMVLYGSRASNGVVVIETKAPVGGALRVTYSGNYKGLVPDLRDYNLVNAAEKLDIEKRAGVYNESYKALQSQGILEDLKHKELEVLRGVNTYWLSEPVRPVFNHRHALSIEGGDNALRYKIYAGLNDAPGVMKYTGVYGKSGSIDIRYRKGKILLSNILFLDQSNSDRTSRYGSFDDYARLNPYYRKYDTHGQIPRLLETATYKDGVQYGRIIDNPMYNTLLNTFDRNEAFDVRNALKIEYLPLESIRVSLDATISSGLSENSAFKPAQHGDFVAIHDIKSKGSFVWNRTQRKGYDVSLTMSYNNMFTNKHFISSFAHFNIKEDLLHTIGIHQTGFPNEYMDEVFLGAMTKGLSGDERTSRSFGVLATVSYTYDQRYALDANIRVDASSEFGANNRFAPFWSVGSRWNIEKESFLKDSSWIRELVLRASYGITGTQGFTPYQALQMYSYNGLSRIYDSSDVIGSQLIGLGNPYLKWQTTSALNIGLDFNLFNGILSGRLEYYDKYTYNTILPLTIAPSIGFTTISENLGNISNKGVEATIRVMPINIPSQQLNLNIVATASHNKNRIAKISNALKASNEEVLRRDKRGNSRPLPRYEEGYSQSMIWAVRSLGIDPQTGEEIFLTRSGERSYKWDPVDMVPVGDTEPKVTGVVSLNLNWRGLSLSLASRYSYGGMLYNYTLVDKVENADLRYNVDKRAYTERWKKAGDVSRFKAVNIQGANTKASTRFLMKNNEIVFNVINAQYRFDTEQLPMLKKMGLTAASIGMHLEDLFRFSTIKIERGTTYPLARQASMSLNLTF